MARRRHTPEQTIRKLREGEKLLNEGKNIDEVCKYLEVSGPTWHRWVAQYGGMKGEDTKRLKELEKQNQRLKKIVDDQALDIDMLKELNLRPPHHRPHLTRGTALAMQPRPPSTRPPHRARTAGGLPHHRGSTTRQ